MSESTFDFSLHADDLLLDDVTRRHFMGDETKTCFSSKFFSLPGH